MLFKDLKPGFTVYSFDRNTVNATTGKVVSVTAPRFENRPGMAAEMVVDVTADFNGTAKTFVFKDTATTGYNGETTVTTDKSEILREVEAIKNNAEQALAQVETNRERLKEAEKIISEFNPELKERKQTEERLNRLENNIDSLKEMLEIFVKQKSTNGSK